MSLEGIELVRAERTRQVIEKGYYATDDIGRSAELARAAACYADFAASSMAQQSSDEPHPFWPWGEESWKPGEAELDTLVKAAALLIASLDALIAEIGMN